MICLHMGISPRVLWKIMRASKCIDKKHDLLWATNIPHDEKKYEYVIYPYNDENVVHKLTLAYVTNTPFLPED